MRGSIPLPATRFMNNGETSRHRDYSGSLSLIKESEAIGMAHQRAGVMHYS